MSDDRAARVWSEYNGGAASYSWDVATFAEVMPLIADHHYARRRPADPVAVFAMRDFSYKPQACAVFAAPANKYFGASAIELVRLVRLPEFSQPLSILISKSLAWIKRTRPQFLYCIAYADTDANHHGGIYQACSFTYIGLSDGHTMYRGQPSDDLFGERPAKITSARSRDQSTDEMKASLTAFKTGPKHLYIRGLHMTTAHAVERLGRKRLPYPKPNAAIGKEKA